MCDVREERKAPGLAIGSFKVLVPVSLIYIEVPSKQLLYLARNLLSKVLTDNSYNVTCPTFPLYGTDYNSASCGKAQKLIDEENCSFLRIRLCFTFLHSWPCFTSLFERCNGMGSSCYCTHVTRPCHLFWNDTMVSTLSSVKNTTGVV